MASEHIETTIFALNNVNLYYSSVELLANSKKYGHATGLTILAWEEFIRAMNFYILACSPNLNPVDKKKINSNIDKSGSGNLASKLEEGLEIAMQIVLTRWLQAKPESFEILINYLTATSDFERATFLDAMLEYLKGDTSDYAINFRRLLELKNNSKLFSKIKKETYLYVGNKNSAPITTTEETLLSFFEPLKGVKSFADSILEFLKELFVNKELFEKYVKFDNNVRLIWPNIIKKF